MAELILKIRHTVTIVWLQKVPLYLDRVCHSPRGKAGAFFEEIGILLLLEEFFCHCLLLIRIYVVELQQNSRTFLV